ncbi:FxSxx-COOH system tetratricopeptide repeat protein [Frankia sp. AgB32]|nr:FxSxx-COOH system tetratricopeptide repeat protein [Frankia sp. AgB32]
MVSADLFGCSERTARTTVVGAARSAITGTRVKPAVAPLFPPDLRTVPERALFPGGLPDVWNVPARLAAFLGRSDQLALVADSLRADGVVTVVALAGMGGVGKTSLALEYAHQHAGDFDVVWWVDAEQADTVPAQIGELGEALGLPAGAEAAGTLAELRRRGLRWLLVFDNAEDIAAVAPFRPVDRRGRVVVTSRMSGWGGLGAVVEVPTLARSESVTLLSGRVADMDPDTADRIAELLGDLVLAVEQAAAFCEQTAIPPAEFAAMLAERLEDTVELGQVTERAGVTVATLWELSVSRLAVADPAAVELLELLSFCGPQPIPLDLFAGRAKLVGEGALFQVLDDQVSWARTVGALVHFGLAGRDTHTVSVHRLVQATTRRRTSPQRKSVVVATLLRLYRADLPVEIQRSPRGWPRWRDLLPHVLTLVERVSKPARTPDGSDEKTCAKAADLTWLCDRIATYLQEHGRSGEALPMFERALAIAETIYGPGHPVTADCLSNLASVLADLGRVDDVLPMFERALVIAEATYGPHHPEVAARLSSVALALRDLGRVAEVLSMFERALTITEASYGPDHSKTLTIRRNINAVRREIDR